MRIKRKTKHLADYLIVCVHFSPESWKASSPSISPPFFLQRKIIRTHHASAGSSLRFQGSFRGCYTFPQSVMVLFVMKVRGNVGAWVRDSRSVHALWYTHHRKRCSERRERRSWSWRGRGQSASQQLNPQSRL